MDNKIACTLKNLREKKNISQNKLAELIGVDRSAIAHWENGDRIPSTRVLMKLADAFNVDVSVFINETAEKASENLVLIVDDEAIALQWANKVVSETLPDAKVVAFKKCSEAIEFAKSNNVSLALLDIEIGQASGLDLSQKIHEINPSTKIIFLTAYPDYALDAWTTYANGFLVKPLKKEALLHQLEIMRNTQNT